MLTAASVMNSAPRVGRRVDGEHVADAPGGAQARIRRDDRVHQFVRMQRALHQRFDLARSRHRHRLVGGRVAMLGRDDLDIRQCRGCAPLPRGGSSLSGPTSTGSIRFLARRLDRAHKRGFVDRMNDRGLQRLHGSRGLDQHACSDGPSRASPRRIPRAVQPRSSSSARRSPPSRPSRDRRADWSREPRSSRGGLRSPSP